MASSYDRSSRLAATKPVRNCASRGDADKLQRRSGSKPDANPNASDLQGGAQFKRDTDSHAQADPNAPDL